MDIHSTLMRNRSAVQSFSTEKWPQSTHARLSPKWGSFWCFQASLLSCVALLEPYFFKTSDLYFWPENLLKKQMWHDVGSALTYEHRWRLHNDMVKMHQLNWVGLKIFGRRIGPRFARKKGGLKSFLGVRVGRRMSHVKWKPC